MEVTCEFLCLRDEGNTGGECDVAVTSDRFRLAILWVKIIERREVLYIEMSI